MEFARKRAGDVHARERLVKNIAGELLEVGHGRKPYGRVPPRTSGLRIFGGRWPAKNAMTFSTAIMAIFVRVSTGAGTEVRREDYVGAAQAVVNERLALVDVQAGAGDRAGCQSLC